MTSYPLVRACALASIGALAGCAGSNDLSDPTHVRTWANAASAVGVYAHAYQPIAVADGAETFADPACPTTSDDGTTLTIAGDCTRDDGRMLLGTATVERGASGDRTLTLDGWGDVEDGVERRLTGTVEVRELSETSHTFTASYVHEGGVTTRVEYEGSVEGTYGTPTVWSGMGTVERSGIAAPTGVVEASTVDQRLDEACPGQAMSGTTTLRADGHDVVITYDGAIDCDADAAAQWSLDGVDQGAITGIACSVGHGRSAPLLVLAALAAAGALLFRRRGTSRVRAPRAPRR